MEDLTSVWQIVTIALLAGGLIGALAYRLLASPEKEFEKVKTELDQARDEMDLYKTSVNRHFGKTAELVNDLTQNYVKVYQHLAEGAQTLGDSKTFDNLLEQQPGKVAIAVDDEPPAPDKIVEDSAEVPIPPEVKVEAVDEHAEPFEPAIDAEPDSPADDGRKAGSPEPENEAESPQPKGETDSPAEESPEPVVNVEALEEAVDTAGSDKADAAAAMMPDSEPKDGARPTTH